MIPYISYNDVLNDKYIIRVDISEHPDPSNSELKLRFF